MNNIGLSETIIQQFKNIFAKYPMVSVIKLYGSRAKGTYHERSDIDLVIMDNNLSRFTVSDILLEIDDSDLPYLVDLQLYSNIKNAKLKEHIDRVGVVFYEKDKTLTSGASNEVLE